ncbi:hypothetical protein ACX0G9_04425 [Flavitalea flava]
MLTPLCFVVKAALLHNIEAVSVDNVADPTAGCILCPTDHEAILEVFSGKAVDN